MKNLSDSLLHILATKIGYFWGIIFSYVEETKMPKNWKKGLTKETDSRVKSHPAWNKGKKSCQVIWNRGLTKETDKRVKEGAEHWNPKSAWNKDLTKETDIRVLRQSEGISLARRSNHPIWNKGLTKETSLILAENSRKISLATSGENSCNWLGGKSFEPYGLEFNRTLRELIRERDNYTCQICGILQSEYIEKLSIHHKDYNKRNNLLNNLTALCRACNVRVNHNRRKWVSYFKKKIPFQLPLRNLV